MKNRPKYRIELCERARGKQRFWFRLKHKNGRIVMTSETYVRKATRTRIANNVAEAMGIL